MIITSEKIEQGYSSKGCLSLAQVRCLLPSYEFKVKGKWPDKGWKRRIIGSDVSESKISEFLALKNKHLRKPAKTGSLFEQKRRANVKCADFDAKVSIDDQNHIDSIMIEV